MRSAELYFNQWDKSGNDNCNGDDHGTLDRGSPAKRLAILAEWRIPTVVSVRSSIFDAGSARQQGRESSESAIYGFGFPSRFAVCFALCGWVRQLGRCGNPRDWWRKSWDLLRKLHPNIYSDVWQPLPQYNRCADCELN
jgi:hypothetical protein